MEPIIFPLIILELTGQNMATGMVFGLMGVTAMIALPIAGKYIDKTSSIQGLKITFTFYTLAFVVLFLANNILIFVIGVIILSLGKSFNGPSFDKIETKRIDSDKRIEYLSYFKAYDTLTAVFAAFLVGLLLKFFSPKIIILFYILFTALGGYSGFLFYNIKLNKESK